MKTLTFDKEHSVRFPTEKEIELIKTRNDRYSPKNGLFQAVFNAYNRHFELTISPDDIYNNICALWAKYVFLNAENFREQIVTHDGKKTINLLVLQNTEWSDELVMEHMNGYIKGINADNNTSIEWMDGEFSTSKKSDIFVRKVCTLASQKAYYDYHSTTMCWLPKINLIGTEQDWLDLEKRIQKMTTFDSHMLIWKSKLLIFINACINCETEDFWQTPMSEHIGGSGSVPYYTGWNTIFNPFDEKGKWGRMTGMWYKIPQDDLLDLRVDFDIECFNQAGEKTGEVKVIAGPSEYSLNENGIFVGNYTNFVYKPV